MIHESKEIQELLEKETYFPLLDQFSIDQMQSVHVERFSILIQFLFQQSKISSNSKVLLSILDKVLDFLKSIQKKEIKDLAYYVTILTLNSFEVISKIVHLYHSKKVELSIEKLKEIFILMLDTKTKHVGGDYQIASKFINTNQLLSTTLLSINHLKWETLNLLSELMFHQQKLEWDKKKYILEKSIDEIQNVNTKQSILVFDTISILILEISKDQLDDFFDLFYNTLIGLDTKHQIECFGTFSQTLFNIDLFKKYPEEMEIILKKNTKKLLEFSKKQSRILISISVQLQRIISSPENIRMILLKDILEFLVMHCEINEDEQLEACDIPLEKKIYPSIYHSHRHIRAMIFSEFYKLRPEKDEKFINELINELFELNNRKFPKNMADIAGSYAHRLKLRLWKCFLLILPSLNEKQAYYIDSKIWKILEGSTNINSVRRLIELLYANLCLMFPKLVDKLKDKLTNYDARAQQIGTLLIITGNILKYCKPEYYFYNLKLLFPFISAMNSCNQHTIRIISQLMFEKIIKRKEFKDILEKDDFLKEIVKVQSEYLNANPFVNKWFSKFDQGFDMNAIDDIKPEILLCKEVIEGESYVNDHIPIYIFEDFYKIEDLVLSVNGIEVKDHFRTKRFIENWKPIYIKGIHTKQLITTGNEKETPVETTQIIQNENTNYQRKITVYSMSDLENELNPRLKIQGRKRNSIIVIASFIDRVPNLAGLTRTCEIFNVDRLVFDSLDVLKNPEYTGVSVSAEKWLPIEQVPQKDLMEYMLNLKKEGWSLVGLEQTQSSISIENFKFPEKSVLLLGKEREGIPVEFIQILDYCVEIPQFGIIRSLNVHVSGSIMLFEYTKQRLLNNKN